MMIMYWDCKKCGLRISGPNSRGVCPSCGAREKPRKKNTEQIIDNQNAPITTKEFNRLRDEVRGYNLGRADMLKWIDWRMGQLPGEDEIAKIINDLDKRCEGELTPIPVLAKALAKRIGKEKI